MTRDPALARLVKHALQREAQQNLSAGHHLMNGHWIPADALRRKTRIIHLRQTVEALVFWAMTALIGLALMAIVVAIL
jgi:hypothetical protein